MKGGQEEFNVDVRVNSDVCAFEIQIHPLLYCHRVTLPCYCMRACMCVCVMGLAGC